MDVAGLGVSREWPNLQPRSGLETILMAGRLDHGGQAPGSGWRGSLLSPFQRRRPVSMTKRIKILRDITLETRKVENEALHGPATIPLSKGAICELTKPPVQSSDNPKKYALVFLPFTRGCLDLFEGVDFEFV